MAVVYHIQFGSRRTYEGDSIHGPREVFDTVARLILIDGEGDRDRWLKDPRGDQYGVWPEDGIWTITMSTQQLLVQTAYDSKILARVKFRQWPLKRGEEGKVTLTTPVNGKTEYLYYVSNIE